MADHNTFTLSMVAYDQGRADERARIREAIEAMRHAHSHEGFVRAWGFIDQVLMEIGIGLGGE